MFVHDLLHHLRGRDGNKTSLLCPQKTRERRVTLKWRKRKRMQEKIATAEMNIIDGVSPSGKAQDFDSCIPQFESGYSSSPVIPVQVYKPVPTF